MKTNNTDIKALVNDIVSSTQQAFGDECAAIYIMGSLARGGFSEKSSDIDLGIILKGSLENVADRLEQLRLEVVSRYPSISNNVSIFWGSTASINGTTDEGRYPPFDRLDLIDHSLLLAGEDIREELVRPTKKELDIASAEFSISYLGNPKRVEEFHNVSSITAQGTVYTSKTILFPARFIYLAKTGEIAGNDVSYRYYVDNFKGADAELVRQGYEWRLHGLPEDPKVANAALDKGLVTLYTTFIDIFIDSMMTYGESRLCDELTQWKQAITG
ncbi:nucleotidyltransferase-like protein [Sinobacterium caligoides]|uniref:Nucleotidyltransferase-like protein n=1 Tax=Sinobacterium caligoides TaxID=933926 RepID=A0A3N2D586_9GAMM|nr:nucleotidyltransferase domain-containing protein [Sinobacterium caligoides]ROR94947.1 nucleotidyltransferase-like protein [Sinobacterium caligoides]